ncbi:hypothetical protein AB0F13_25020, partial [Streptomyces sp. NPDC026206]|uniref:hypothetical protein n=1 Tax=Streptomyces sp. NPDC026206 TaxID=3157089 RepID=UPI0033D15AA1
MPSPWTRGHLAPGLSLRRQRGAGVAAGADAHEDRGCRRIGTPELAPAHGLEATQTERRFDLVELDRFR